MAGRLVATAAACGLTLSCGGGTPDAPDGATPDGGTPAVAVRAEETVLPADHPLATAPARATLSARGMRLDLLSVQRLTGGHVIARYRVWNRGRESWSWADLGTSKWTSYPGWARLFNRVALADFAGGRLYTPSADSDGRCLCTDLGELPDDRLAPGGGPAVLWAVYPVPDSVPDVSMYDRIGVTAPVPVTAAGAPAPQAVGEPTAGDLTGVADHAFGLFSPVEAEQQRTDETGGTVAVQVPTDVLFEFGEAELSELAQEQLGQVARRLDAEATGTVRIVGHTDSIGGDEVNLPLSVARAEAVQGALQKLVDRKSVV